MNRVLSMLDVGAIAGSSAISKTARLVACFLGARANPHNGEVYWAAATLAVRLGLSRREVHYALAELEQHSLVVTTQRWARGAPVRIVRLPRVDEKGESLLVGPTPALRSGVPKRRREYPAPNSAQPSHAPNSAGGVPNSACDPAPNSACDPVPNWAHELRQGNSSIEFSTPPTPSRDDETKQQQGGREGFRNRSEGIQNGRSAAIPPGAVGEAGLPANWAQLLADELADAWADASPAQRAAELRRLSPADDPARMHVSGAPFAQWAFARGGWEGLRQWARERLWKASRMPRRPSSPPALAAAAPIPNRAPTPRPPPLPPPFEDVPTYDLNELQAEMAQAFAAGADAVKRGAA